MVFAQPVFLAMWDMQFSTVDGRNPAPPRMYKTL